MASVAEIARRLLPKGSRWGRSGWNLCPSWPPDVFAVAATIVELSGCYASHRPGERLREKYIHHICSLGRQWREKMSPPPPVTSWWQHLISSDSDPVAMLQSECEAAMSLLAVSDEASVGIGFDMTDPSYFQSVYLAAKTKSAVRKKASNLLPNVRGSICSLVSPYEACVQPKSRTAQVGCTLRSCSHHLALLPPLGVVSTDWIINAAPAGHSGHLNLLVVPFPYRVPADVFEAHDSQGRSGHYFGVRQKWLPRRSGQFVGFIEQLCDAAQKSGGRVDAIVLPELSLDSKTSNLVATSLHRRGLEFFIAGTANNTRTASENFAEIHVGRDWSRQPKHHRWCLDNGQIKRYGLAHILDAAQIWWEDIALPKREVNFVVFRPGATLAVLICEDLARVDPAQVVLRSVGANLVIALLFDGPQLENRWPARYATVLADDPGSSVLSVTSLGMALRARNPTSIRGPGVEVAMWKEPGNAAQPLILQATDHAILLSLALHTEENRTLDGRSDQGTSYRVSLEQHQAIRLSEQPEWVHRDFLE